jgi:arabinogalactan oligomer/maltooligosaccharide transport system permease protein
MTTAPNSRRLRRELGYIAKYALAGCLMVFAAVPFLWVLATSFNAAKSLLGATLIPATLTLGNYVELLTSTAFNYSAWFANSLKISLVSVALIVLITSTAGYALSRFRFRGKKSVMMGIMLVNVFPGTLAMIALYVMFQQIGGYLPGLGLNSHASLVLVYVSGAMSINVLMMKAYIDTIPMEIDESALVEGATWWQSFRMIVFPMIRPMVITIGILAFMGTYGDFILANLLLKGNEKITVMVGIFQFTQQRFDTDWGVVTAGTIIAALPVVAMFFVAQKHVIAGLTSGAVKQ